jgi:hypothetical protein
LFPLTLSGESPSVVGPVQRGMVDGEEVPEPPTGGPPDAVPEEMIAGALMVSSSQVASTVAMMGPAPLARR